MDQSTLEQIIDTAIPGAGFTRAGQPKLLNEVWIIPFGHYQFGAGQIFLPDREVRGTLDRDTVAREIEQRLGLAIALAIASSR